MPLEVEIKTESQRQCPRCNGNMLPEEDEQHERQWHCLQCGKTLPWTEEAPVEESKKMREGYLAKGEQLDQLSDLMKRPVPAKATYC